MTEPISRPIAISYLIVGATILLAGWLKFSTLLLTVLFSLVALNALRFQNRRWLAIGLFLVLVGLVFSGFGYFLHRAVDEQSRIVSSTVPNIVQFANDHGIELPFDDPASLKEFAIKTVREALGYLGNFAKIATKEFVMLVIGLVIAIGIFLYRDPIQEANASENLYTFYHCAIISRFRAFYRSFETVMGAQLLISLINTVATSFFLIITGLPYPGLLIPLTFLCGLLPIVGNLISNTGIVAIAFGHSPQAAGWALLFLILIHKSEYFLNSKIIGSRIRHPMWLTLIAIVVGESVMGMPGIILAPVVLNYLKVESSRFRAPPSESK